MHTHAPACTHIRTQIYVILIAVPWQWWFCGCVSVLHYMYIVSLVYECFIAVEISNIDEKTNLSLADK